jgi:hypothetical protein
MSRFLVLEIYFLFLFSGYSEIVGWNHFLHDSSVEDAGNNYGVDILIDLTIWRLLFLDGDTKTGMMSPPWNNFLR